LKEQRGKVVVVNFWATWCPPCRKEMPDLETLYKQFKDQGLVILAISDEDAGKVGPFIAEQKVTLSDPARSGRKVNELFQIEGIPKTFVYDRSGSWSRSRSTCEPEDSFWRCWRRQDCSRGHSLAAWAAFCTKMLIPDGPFPYMRTSSGTDFSLCGFGFYTSGKAHRLKSVLLKSRAHLADPGRRLHRHTAA